MKNIIYSAIALLAGLSSPALELEIRYERNIYNHNNYHFYGDVNCKNFDS